MTDDGPRLLVNSPHRLPQEPNLSLAPVLFTLNYGVSRSKAIQLMKEFHLLISTIVDHSPIFLQAHDLALSKGANVEEMIFDQRIHDDEGWYKDEFGLYVYSYSYFVPKDPCLEDRRYAE